MLNILNKMKNIMSRILPKVRDWFGEVVDTLNCCFRMFFPCQKHYPISGMTDFLEGYLLDTQLITKKLGECKLRTIA